MDMGDFSMSFTMHRWDGIGGATHGHGKFEYTCHSHRKWKYTWLYLHTKWKNTVTTEIFHNKVIFQWLQNTNEFVDE